MAKRFGAHSRSFPNAARERLIYVGGGVMTAALFALVIALVYNFRSADAVEKPLMQETEAVVDIGSVTLLAPIESIPRGTKISGEQLRVIYWPRNDVPEGAVRNIDDIRDMYAKDGLRPNQPILRASLSAAPLLGGVADLIPPGHRAVTIEVDATAGVEGWARPGAHVDIVLTYNDRTENVNRSLIIVENATVISFDGTIDRGNTTTESQTTSRVRDRATVTLSVPVEDALKIQTAMPTGRITLLLRNPDDPKSAGNISITGKDFRGEPKKEPKESNTRPQGFARFTDPSGESRQVELREGRWFRFDSGQDEGQ